MSASHRPRAKPIKVLFVCLGNICRSPTAEGVFRDLAEQRGLRDLLFIDSAGTGGWHAGEPADRRMRAACQQRGYRLTSKARKVEPEDFSRFDHIIAMDRDNEQNLLAQCPTALKSKIRLFRSLEPDAENLDVPDPYYGGREGFELVIDLVERCSALLLDELEPELPRAKS
ncbi:MAG: low molecular weight protein-tyrosine-phosphatase [Myxococcota bacterium]